MFRWVVIGLVGMKTIENYWVVENEVVLVPADIKVVLIMANIAQCAPADIDVTVNAPEDIRKGNEKIL
jgi:hypothetical protein